MEYVYATLILHETGKEINETNLTAVLESAGEAVSESRVKAVVAALEDVDLAATKAETMATGEAEETVIAQADDEPAGGDTTAPESDRSDGAPNDDTEV